MTGRTFRFRGEDLLATAEGALWWPAEATLVAADLHLEKGSSFGRRGAFLPPYDSRATLTVLGALLERLDPRRVVCLGDSFHDATSCARLAAEDSRRLQALAQGRDWLWIAGNHDPRPARGLCGRTVAEVAIGPLVFRHEALADAGDGGEISGHFHPKASVSVVGRRLSGRCFVTDGRRLILPAFGAYTGGLDVFDAAIARLLAPAFIVHLLGRARIHTLPHARLVQSQPALRGTANG
jgi:DNA ligase-associated metallophosphoesterase